MVKVVWESSVDDRHVIKIDSKEDFEKNPISDDYNIRHYGDILTVEWDGKLPAYYEVADYNDSQYWNTIEQITDVHEWCEQMAENYNHVADSLYKFSNGVR